MPRTGGSFSLLPSYKATSGQTIRTEQHNPPLEDIAVALTGSLPRDGSAPMTGSLPMNGQRVTNLGAGTSASDAVRRDQVTLYNAYLSSVAGLALEANTFPYATAAGAAAKTALTPLARTFLSKTTAAEQRTALELVPGTSANQIVQLDGSAKLPAVDGSALTGLETIGTGQAWSDVTSFRFRTTTYRNTTGKPIMVQITHNSNTTGEVQASTNGSSWVKIADARIGGTGLIASFIVPDDHYYRTYGSIETWAELR